MRQRNLHSHTISTTMYEKIDPWRRIPTISLRAKGKKWYSVIKLTTPFIQSHMVRTVSLESRAVASVSGGNLKSASGNVAMRFALKDITMTEDTMVFAVKKKLQNPAKTGMQNVQSHKRWPYERLKDISKSLNSFLRVWTQGACATSGRGKKSGSRLLPSNGMNPGIKVGLRNVCNSDLTGANASDTCLGSISFIFPSLSFLIIVPALDLKCQTIAWTSKGRTWCQCIPSSCSRWLMWLQGTKRSTVTEWISKLN